MLRTASPAFVSISNSFISSSILLFFLITKILANDQNTKLPFISTYFLFSVYKYIPMPSVLFFLILVRFEICISSQYPLSSLPYSLFFIWFLLYISCSRVWRIIRILYSAFYLSVSPVYPKILVCISTYCSSIYTFSFSPTSSGKNIL